MTAGSSPFVRLGHDRGGFAGLDVVQVDAALELAVA
eukprot:CAMPEP_0176177988 /NCGR_PEP_ID=MMETSP0120_2-20121206/91193_1 /TAXON_ID=160619 /ORGANISM="Kryptoperidinium foliaceum, Strain CCMP 1326" /LENGTH=35 /DNA_ID= /DNA_START= /DNA_END= /DNA_ORIENTATION=